MQFQGFCLRFGSPSTSANLLSSVFVEFPRRAATAGHTLQIFWPKQSHILRQSVSKDLELSLARAAFGPGK